MNIKNNGMNFNKFADVSSDQTGRNGDPNQHLEMEKTQLMICCEQEQNDEVKKLLRNNATVGAVDSLGRTALHYCVENRSTKIAAMLLNRNLSIIDVRDVNGYTALQMSVMAGNLKMVDFLIDQGADARARDNEQRTLIHWATVCGHVQLIDVLVDHGAYLSSTDKYSASPLHYVAQMCGAAEEDDGEYHVTSVMLLQRLIARKALIDTLDLDSRTPLFWAASCGSVEACELLLRAGSNPNHRDKDGLTALHCAAARGQTRCIDLLLKKKAIPVDVTDFSGCSPLFYSVSLGHVETTAALLQRHRSNPNQRDNRLRSPAHCAAAKGSVECLRVLRAAKGDLWLQNAKGDYPIHEAVLARQNDAVKYLLKLKPECVDISNNDGRTCLHIAALTNNVPLVSYLVDSNASKKCVMYNNGHAVTPYDGAVCKSNLECASILKLDENGATLNGLDTSTSTDSRAFANTAASSSSKIEVNRKTEDKRKMAEKDDDKMTDHLKDGPSFPEPSGKIYLGVVENQTPFAGMELQKNHMTEQSLKRPSGIGGKATVVMGNNNEPNGSLVNVNLKSLTTVENGDSNADKEVKEEIGDTLILAQQKKSASSLVNQEDLDSDLDQSQLDQVQNQISKSQSATRTIDQHEDPFKLSKESYDTYGSSGSPGLRSEHGRTGESQGPSSLEQVDENKSVKIDDSLGESRENRDLQFLSKTGHGQSINGDEQVKTDVSFKESDRGHGKDHTSELEKGKFYGEELEKGSHYSKETEVKDHGTSSFPMLKQNENDGIPEAHAADLSVETREDQGLRGQSEEGQDLKVRINEGKTVDSLKELAKHCGMNSLLRLGEDKAVMDKGDLAKTQQKALSKSSQSELEQNKSSCDEEGKTVDLLKKSEEDRGLWPHATVGQSSRVPVECSEAVTSFKDLNEDVCLRSLSLTGQDYSVGTDLGMTADVPEQTEENQSQQPPFEKGKDQSLGTDQALLSTSFNGSNVQENAQLSLSQPDKTEVCSVTFQEQVLADDYVRSCIESKQDQITNTESGQDLGTESSAQSRREQDTNIFTSTEQARKPDDLGESEDIKDNEPSSFRREKMLDRDSPLGLIDGQSFIGPSKDAASNIFEENSNSDLPKILEHCNQLNFQKEMSPIHVGDSFERFGNENQVTLPSESDRQSLELKCDKNVFDQPLSSENQAELDLQLTSSLALSLVSEKNDAEAKKQMDNWTLVNKETQTEWFSESYQTLNSLEFESVGENAGDSYAIKSTSIGDEANLNSSTISDSRWNKDSKTYCDESNYQDEGKINSPTSDDLVGIKDTCVSDEKVKILALRRTEEEDICRKEQLENKSVDIQKELDGNENFQAENRTNEYNGKRINEISLNIAEMTNSYEENGRRYELASNRCNYEINTENEANGERRPKSVIIRVDGWTQTEEKYVNIYFQQSETGNPKNRDQTARNSGSAINRSSPKVPSNETCADHNKYKQLNDSSLNRTGDAKDYEKVVTKKKQAQKKSQLLPLFCENDDKVFLDSDLEDMELEKSRSKINQIIWPNTAKHQRWAERLESIKYVWYDSGGDKDDELPVRRSASTSNSREASPERSTRRRRIHSISVPREIWLKKRSLKAYLARNSHLNVAVGRYLRLSTRETRKCGLKLRESSGLMSREDALKLYSDQSERFQEQMRIYGISSMPERPSAVVRPLPASRKFSLVSVGKSPISSTHTLKDEPDDGIVMEILNKYKWWQKFRTGGLKPSTNLIQEYVRTFEMKRLMTMKIQKAKMLKMSNITKGQISDRIIIKQLIDEFNREAREEHRISEEFQFENLMEFCKYLQDEIAKLEEEEKLLKKLEKLLHLKSIDEIGPGELTTLRQIASSIIDRQPIGSGHKCEAGNYPNAVDSKCLWSLANHGLKVSKSAALKKHCRRCLDLDRPLFRHGSINKALLSDKNQPAALTSDISSCQHLPHLTSAGHLLRQPHSLGLSRVSRPHICTWPKVVTSMLPPVYNISRNTWPEGNTQNTAKGTVLKNKRSSQPLQLPVLPAHSFSLHGNHRS